MAEISTEPKRKLACAGALRSLSLALEALHILVGQAEMVPDLVDKHVSDDRTQRLFVRRPVVQDRPPVEVV